jgi:tetratricopeptide (TPR) repeat protein
MKYTLMLVLLIAHACYGQDVAKMKQLFMQGMAYEDKGDINDAIKTDLTLYKMDTTNYVVATVLAGLYGKNSDFTQEITWAGKAVSLQPNFFNGYINLGNGYSGSGDIINAEKYYKKALAIDSTSPLPYYSLGLIEESKKDLKSAIVYYNKSVSVDSTFVNGYINLAAANANLGDFKTANTNILKAAELDPQSKDIQELHVQIIEALLR